MLDTDSLLENLITARDLVFWGADYLEASDIHFGHGSDNPLDEALAIVRHVAEIDWQSDESVYDQSLDIAIRRRVLSLLQARVTTRKPASYLTGEAWFCGLKFEVNEDVLVPRSPFSELIDRHFEPWLAGKVPENILDLCTGSGCIAIACAVTFPEASVDATDLSEAALKVAAKNVQHHGLGEKLRLFRADVFDGLPQKRYDLIVSNPPYVSKAEMKTLPAEYLHEPRMALEAEDDGLAIVERMLKGAPEYLADDGYLIIEVGNSQQAVEARWPDLPMIWLEFERGGDGVFIIDAEKLRDWKTGL